MRDDVLEAGFARRDAASFERAYESFGSLMYTAAFRVLRNEQLARDCVHDVMLRLWNKAGAYSPDRGRLEAFLVVCARNAALAYVRDTSRRRDIVAQTHPGEEATYDADPLEHEEVTQALRRLSEPHARVISLAYYGGMTHSEIASRLGEPIGTIKSRLSAALRTLRSILGEEVNR